MARTDRRLCRLLALFAGALWLLVGADQSHGQQPPPGQPRAGGQPQTRGHEAEWLWLPQQPGPVPLQQVGLFRKTFELRGRPEQAEVHIAADDAYIVYANGRQVGTGDRTKDELDSFDLAPFLNRGRNTIAIRVTNLRGDTAAIAARVMVKEPQREWRSYSTDPSWKAMARAVPLWNVPFFNDSSWPAAHSFGLLGETAPWDVEEGVPATQTDLGERFTISDEFSVERVLDNNQLGSLIAMAFNEFGQIIISEEGGPLQLVYDSDSDGLVESVRPLCEQVRNCQGILPLNGDIYVTGDGPNGAALYRLQDGDQDGVYEQVTAIIKFRGEPSEHGAHGVALGPDGYLYVVVGNHTGVQGEYHDTSPYRNPYEGDLVERYEDPGGHAVGIKAPGGIVLRTDSRGERVELFAGGLRNAYDLVFSEQGELFVHDSDMEADLGTTWYRPTRLLHVTAGGEYGWRSGWAKWPEHYVDSLPSSLETGRGSPTGGVMYHHFAFPAKYYGAMFLADWSEGRILAVRLKRQESGYAAESEVFLKGAPLNVCDLEIGPDGALWFATGGRGTAGGIYRVSWRGSIPENVRNLGEGISRAIRQPQLHSAWGRQQVAEVKAQLGDQWAPQVEGVAVSTANPELYRIRALDLLQLFGPAPDPAMLVTLARDKSEAIRAKSAYLMSLYDSPVLRAQLTEMLVDGDRLVRRCACEGLLRAGWLPNHERLIPLLESDDRFESFAARRLLERIPTEQWRESLLTHDNHRVVTQAALALMIAEPTPDNALDVLDRFQQLMQGFISDRNFIDLLRTAQVAVSRAGIGVDEAPDFERELAQEFPAGNVMINRELVRLLVHFQINSLIPEYLEYLESDAPQQEKIHLAMHLRYLETGWENGQRLEVLRVLERAAADDTEPGLAHYAMNIATDLARNLSEEDSVAVVADAAEWPSAALGALFNLPEELDDDEIRRLCEMDQQVAAVDNDATQRLRVGVVAVLARTKSSEAMDYLRRCWNQEPDRRGTIAMGLAQAPDGDNWPYLMRSLPVLDGEPAVEVLAKLREVRKAPTEPEYLRQALLCGLRLEDARGLEAAKLLAFWTGQNPVADDADAEQALAAWQDWLAERHPELPRAELPTAENNRWDPQELIEFLSSGVAAGDTQRGALVFREAQCVRCHRYGSEGETMGPDLSSIAKRFSRKEIIESVLFPSHVISSQYASQIIQTDSGQRYEGLVAPGPKGTKIVLTAKGEKVTVEESEIERIQPSKVSSMPEGLLNELTLEQIADLFAFLGAGQPNVARRPANTPR